MSNMYILFFIAATIVACIIATAGMANKSPLSELTKIHHPRHQKTKKFTSSSSSSCPPRPFFPSNQKAPKSSPDLPQTVMDNILSYVKEHTQAPCKPGAHSPSAPSFSGAVIFGNKTYFIQTGCTDVQKPNSSTPTPDTSYRLASVSKTFTVKLLLDAFEQGHINSLDDEVRKHLPEFFVPNPYGDDQPTWAQLASQQAGLPRDSPCFPLLCNITLDEAIERIGQQRLMADPWTRPSYSNFAFSLIGNSVATRIFPNNTYSSFDEALEVEVIRKLNLSNSTGTKLDAQVLKNLAIAYTPYGIADPPFSLYFDTPAGGIYSSARDLASWLQHFIGKFKTSALYRRTMQPSYIDGSLNTGWAMPWELFDTDKKFGYIVRSKDGYLPGVSTFIAMVPEVEVGFVGLWNGEGFAPKDAGAFAIHQILEAAIPLLQAADEKIMFAPPSANWMNNFVKNGWIGNYGITLTLDAIHATIALDSATQRITINVPGFGHFYLKPGFGDSGDGVTSFVFQIYDPSTDYDECQRQAFAGYDNEWVYFSIDPKTNKKQLLVPGYVYVKFLKEA